MLKRNSRAIFNMHSWNLPPPYCSCSSSYPSETSPATLISLSPSWSAPQYNTPLPSWIHDPHARSTPTQPFQPSCVHSHTYAAVTPLSLPSSRCSNPCFISSSKQSCTLCKCHTQLKAERPQVKLPCSGHGYRVCNQNTWSTGMRSVTSEQLLECSTTRQVAWNVESVGLLACAREQFNGLEYALACAIVTVSIQ